MSAEMLDLLRHGEIEVQGKLPWSSNTTLLVEVRGEGSRLLGVYKPGRGERPLWDFPAGLYRREIAAYELATWLEWPVIPETVLRDDAPLGSGSIQRFVDHDPDRHYFTLLDEGGFEAQLRRLCVFDVLINATDRKGGHILVDADGHLWGIDNGLSFHEEFKLRTVVWHFAGESLPDELRPGLERLCAGDLPPQLDELLSPDERDAVSSRARSLLHDGRLPVDPSGRRWPWPLV